MWGERLVSTEGTCVTLWVFDPTLNAPRKMQSREQSSRQEVTHTCQGSVISPEQASSVREMLHIPPWFILMSFSFAQRKGIGMKTQGGIAWPWNLHHTAPEKEYSRDEKAANMIFRGNHHKPKTEELHSITTACETESGARSSVSYDALIPKRKGERMDVAPSLQEITVRQCQLKLALCTATHLQLIHRIIITRILLWLDFTLNFNREFCCCWVLRARNNQYKRRAAINTGWDGFTPH